MLEAIKKGHEEIKKICEFISKMQAEIGKPKFEYGQKVRFTISDQNGNSIEKIGTIEIIDRHGTFFDTSDVSYDILVEDENCLYKHITERQVEMTE